jgi:predicted aminopeptidase
MILTKWRALAGLLLIAWIIAGHTGCAGPGYYAQAVSGQLRLMHARQDIDKLLNDPGTDPALAGQLSSAGEILRFARESMNMPAGDSYTSYVRVEGDAMVWNVIATEEFSLEARTWCFPVAGCVPYRGYFKHEKAQDFASRLKKKGMDVHVSPAAAYSTLGWFSDPLPSTMTSGSDVRLAAYLFHELAHQRLWVKGDGRFNEAYASFIEEVALRQWLKSQDRDEELAQWASRRNAAADFRDLVGEVRMKLSQLYQSAAPDHEKRTRKAGIFETIPVTLEQLRTDRWEGRKYYASWSKGPYNNARIAIFSTYEGAHCAFAGLWEEAGGDVRIFHRLAEKRATLESTQRQAWLNRACQNIAPSTDL